MMKTMDKLDAGLRLCCLGLAVWFTTAFVFVALMTLNFPFPLEWMEGHIIDIIARVAHGEAIYTPPSIEYVPLVYTPYYYYVSAFVSLITGVDFLPARLVSFLSALGTGGILYSWIKREGGDWKEGLIAAGLFFATYTLSGRWFDIARIDSLHLLLVMSGLYLLFHGQGRYNNYITALLFALAFFTKQSAVMLVAPAIATWLLIDRKKALVIGSTTAALIVLGIVTLNSKSNGWFNFYVFEVPAAHNLYKQMIVAFWTREMLANLAILFALTAGAATILYKSNRSRGIAYLALIAGMLIGTYISRLHYGSYLNVLMPAHAMLALMGGLALILFKRIQLHDLPLMSITLGLIIIQFGWLLYNPMKLIPAPDAAEKGNAFLQEIGAIEGDVFMPGLQFVSTRVGKRSFAYGMGAFDLFRARLGDKESIKGDLQNEMRGALTHQRFGGLVPTRLFPLPEKKDFYVLKRTMEYPNPFMTGVIKSQPGEIYVRATTGSTAP